MATRSVSIGGTLTGPRFGWLSAGLKVLVVRHGTQDYATNRLTLPTAEIRLYRIRAQIEEVMSVCQDQFGLSGCQARSERARVHRFTCCLVAFCVLEQERHDRGLTLYKLKRQLSCHGRMLALPALERLRRTA
jgi:hypothetical protein